VAVDQDAALLGVVEAGHQRHRGRLAGPGRADQGDQLAWLDPERHLRQCRAQVRPVGEADPVEGDPTADLYESPGAFAVGDLGRQVQQREDAVEQRQRPGDVDVQAAELPDRAAEPAGHARLEAGRVAPRLETLDRVASALDVTLVVAFQEPPGRDRRRLPG
jgi:hypothetical protein